MNQSSTARSYALRLPASIREMSAVLAQTEGVSLNYFISLAVSEKVLRMEQAAQMKGARPALAR